MEIRCSGLARPMACAGYLSFKDLFKPEAGKPAELGTGVGEYLEWMLTGQPLRDVASNGVFIDEDAKFYTKQIYDDIMSRTATPIRCETRIDWMTRSGVKIRGQYDICFVDKMGRLCVEDLKYGFGIVEVRENWQLLGYTIGEILRLGQAFEEISLKIHQPRAHHPLGTTREWVLSYQDVLDYKERIEQRLLEIVHGRNDLQTGEKCKYCEAAAEACPAFNKIFHRALEVSHEFVQDSLTNQEIAHQLNEIKRAKEVLKIKEDSLTQLGVMKLGQGQIIPGYVKEETYGKRVWKNNVSPEVIKMMTGVDVVETTFMSPYKAEKAGVKRKFVNELTDKQFRGVKLVKKDMSDEANNIFGTGNPMEVKK